VSASLWEIAIKYDLRRPDFEVDSRLLRRNLLTVTGEHAAAVTGLPLLHRDPFDRMLVAQSIVEGIMLLTGDPLVARYPGPIQRV